MNQSQEHDQDGYADGGVDGQVQQVERTRVRLRPAFSGTDAAGSGLSDSSLDLPRREHRHEQVCEMKHNRPKNLFRGIKGPDLEGPLWSFSPPFVDKGKKRQKAQRCLNEYGERS